MAYLGNTIVNGLLRAINGIYASGDCNISGTLTLSKDTDTAGAANNKPALIVGGTDTTAHIEIDGNEIMAKSSGTATGPLYLNNDGGNVYVNNKLVSLDGHIHSYLPLTGGTLTNQLIVQTTSYGNFNQGIRINKSGNGYATFMLGGNAGTTGGNASANGGWQIEVNSGNQLFVSNATSANTTSSAFWIDTDKKVTMTGACNVVGSLTQNGTAVSLSNHTHNYAGSSSAGGAATSAVTATTCDYPKGFTALRTSATWGTGNGIGTFLTGWGGPDTCDIAFRNNGGQLNVVIDGKYYQNEGNYQVLDTSSSLNAAKLTGTVPASCYTNTTYTAGNSMTLSSTTFNVGKRWNAVTQGQKWSRIMLVTPVVSVEGTAGILSVSCTRGSVVCNATFYITSSHAGSGYTHITQLSSNNYTAFKIRAVSSNQGIYYFEIYDTANSIASGTAQTWHCTYIPILDATVTMYTVFTDGSSIPSGYSAMCEQTTVLGSNAHAIRNITRSGTTFTATRQDGTTFTFTQQDNNTTYTGSNGISLSGTTFSNSGVRSIATGSSNGTISVNTNGTATNVAVKGLGTAAYTNLSSFHKHGSAYPGGGSKPWHLIAQFQQSVASQQINTGISFYVSEFFAGISYGILNIRARYEGNQTTPSFFSASWSLACNIDTNNFIITHQAIDKNITLKLYCKRTGWSSYAFNKIEEQSWGGEQDVWTCFNSNNSAALESIPSDETQIVSIISNINNTAPVSTHTHSYLPLSGGTLTGALTFANGTWNTVGDDAQIGDFNVAGTLGIRGANGTTAIALVTKGSTTDYAKISYDGTNITLSKPLSGYSTTSHTHNYAGSSSAGGAATSVVTTSITADADKNIYFVNGSNTVGYNANLVYNPSVNLLKTKSIGTTDSHLFAFVDGGFYSGEGTVTGALCITLPVSWTATMMSFQVTIYNYVDNDSTVYFISGYNYTGGSGSWVSCSAHAIGKRILNVRFGHNGTKCVVVIGETNTTWAYPKVAISNLLIGHSGVVDKTWCTGWNIAPVTTLPSTINKVIDPGINLTRTMTAATANAAGLTGLVPAPAAGKQTSFLRGDGTWVIPTDTKYTHPNTVTAGTVGTSAATSGSTLAVPYVTYNANGHVTATGTHTHTITGFATSDHTHSYLPLTGGTITGSLTLNSGFAWPAPANISCTSTANGQEWSIDMVNTTYTGTYWHVWSGKTSKSCIQCYNDNCNVTVPNGTFTASKDIVMNGTNGTNYLQLPSGIKLY